MSKNKKPAKKYRPRLVNPAMILNQVLMRAQALASTDKLEDSQQTALSLRNWASFNAITKGNGEEFHANDLVNAANVALVMAEAGLGREFIPHIRAAQRSIVTMGARHEQRGKWLFTGQEIQLVREMLEIHDAQLQSDDCTEGYLMKCIEEVKARIVRGQVDKLEALA
jgi:hypothetical protein